MKALNLMSETVVSVNLVSSVVLSPSVSLSKHDFWQSQSHNCRSLAFAILEALWLSKHPITWITTVFSLSFFLFNFSKVLWSRDSVLEKD